MTTTAWAAATSSSLTTTPAAAATTAAATAPLESLSELLHQQRQNSDTANRSHRIRITGKPGESAMRDTRDVSALLNLP